MNKNQSKANLILFDLKGLPSIKYLQLTNMETNEHLRLFLLLQYIFQEECIHIEHPA